ncbi:MAG: hypothetical protein HGA37_17370 [Lentimicrobium sp.]|nr:hypothetical protein [Lentimicrobium sp.]
MKKLTLIAMMFSLCIFLGNKSFGAISGDDNKWARDKSVSNVDLYYMIGECNGEKVIFLKFDNKNNYSVKITWIEAFTDKTFNSVVENFNGAKQLTLPPGVTSQDGCNAIAHPECLINMNTVDPTHPVDPLNLEFKDVTVSKVTN